MTTINAVSSDPLRMLVRAETQSGKGFRGMGAVYNRTPCRAYRFCHQCFSCLTRVCRVRYTRFLSGASGGSDPFRVGGVK